MRLNEGRAETALDEVTIGDAAVICGVTRDAINKAMGDGRLRYRRRADGRRIAKVNDVIAFRRHLWNVRPSRGGEGRRDGA